MRVIHLDHLIVTLVAQSHNRAGVGCNYGSSTLTIVPYCPRRERNKIRTPVKTHVLKRSHCQFCYCFFNDLCIKQIHYVPGYFKTSVTINNYCSYSMTGANVPVNCGPDDFQCDDGYCIKNDLVCDKKKDCSDGEDELEEVCSKSWF